MDIKNSTDHDIPQVRERFFDVGAEPCQMLAPIQGYEKKPLVSLEEAVEPIVSIVPDVKRMAYIAKERCKKILDSKLSFDEAASLMLYTLEWEPHEDSFYVILNATLRAADRKKLTPWFLFLKLVLTAYDRLPSLNRPVIYRGVTQDLTEKYCKGEKVTWWGFSSCTSTLDVLENEQFLGSTGARTFFSIECTSGKNIKEYSIVRNEDEVLLPPARLFQIVACLKQSGGLNMIQLKEIEPPYPLLGRVSQVN